MLWFWSYKGIKGRQKDERTQVNKLITITLSCSLALITIKNTGALLSIFVQLFLEVTVTACLSSKKHWTNHPPATSPYCTRMAGNGMTGRNFWSDTSKDSSPSDSITTFGKYFLFKYCFKTNAQNQ